MLRSFAVVASGLGAFVEVLGTAGVTFRTGDATALAVLLARLMKNPTEVVPLGRLVRGRVIEFFQRSRMIEHHPQLYRRVAAGQLH